MITPAIINAIQAEIERLGAAEYVECRRDAMGIVCLEDSCDFGNLYGGHAERFLVALRALRTSPDLVLPGRVCAERVWHAYRETDETL